MQQLDELIRNVKEALTREGLLNNVIQHTGTRQDPYTEYTLESIPGTTRSAQQRKISLQTQAYSQPCIVELASWYGYNGAGWIAKQAPHAEIRLISNIQNVSFPLRNFLFNKVTHRDTDLYFENGRDFPTEPDIERRVNRLYQCNGLENVQFYGHILTFDDSKLTSTKVNTKEFLKKKDNRPMIIMAYEAPIEVPFIAAQLYNQQNANMFVLSPSGTELLLPNSPAWDTIQQEIRFNDTELTYFKSNTIDEELQKTYDFSKQKYDYTNQIQRRQGQLIKLTIAAAIAKTVQGQVMRDSDRGFQIEDDLHNYNKPDFYIVAQR